MRRCLVCLLVLAACGSDPAPPPSASVELVGHSDLLARGMNSAAAIIGNHMYIGSRTDGAEVHENAGVLIVDVSDPTAPTVVGQIGRPEQALSGVSSRELRAIPDKDLLMVLNFTCSPDLHACTIERFQWRDTGGAEEADNIRFYDVSNPTEPQLVAKYDFGSSPANPEVSPHEFYLWRDPADADRVLLYVSTPVGPPAMQVLDISDLQNIHVIADFDPEDDAGLEEPRGNDALLHSVSVNAGGDIAFISYESAGLIIADASEIAMNQPSPQIRLLTPIDKRIDYSPPHPSGTHSAVAIPDRDLVIVTDEIYPAPAFAGCPWGWARIVDYTDTQEPFIAGEYRAAENDSRYCTTPGGGPDFVTMTAHNTTATQNLALISWHSAGLEIVDTSDATKPEQLIRFVPEPIASVAIEDPALGGNPVLMWSYPIIKDGLIYVVDIRNGLYILRYDGPFASEIRDAAFSEGNSNLR